jgi:hypothetical protein
MALRPSFSAYSWPSKELADERQFREAGSLGRGEHSRRPLRVTLRSIAAACYNLDTQIALLESGWWVQVKPRRGRRHVRRHEARAPALINSAASRRITRSTTGRGKFAVTRDHLAAAIGRVGHSADMLEKYLNRGRSSGALRPSSRRSRLPHALPADVRRAIRPVPVP